MSVIQSTLKNTRELLETNKESATVIAKDEILAMTGGYLVPADSGTVAADLLGVANESIAAADA